MSLQRQQPTHTCHALGCAVEILPKLHMCFTHWMMVPKPLRRQLWLAYRRGQEIDKNPSKEYLATAQQCIAVVAEKERAKKETT